MEGLHMYLMPGIVDEIRSLIVKNSGKGSAIIFDYCPQSVVNGSCELVVGKNIHDGLTKSWLTKRVFFPWDQRRMSSMQPIVFKPVQWSNKSDGSS
jgi:O-methyltransferase involved in polyketide biosynthesis